VYCTYANDDAIRQTTVDLETGETGETGEAATVWEGLDDAFTEAPHLYEVDGTYYLLAAEGGTHGQHMVSVARSDDPTGPFEDHPDNPIFSHRSRVMQPIAATGHGDLVQAHDGSWWMTFLGIRQQGEHVPYHRNRPRDVPCARDMGGRLAGRQRQRPRRIGDVRRRHRPRSRG